MNTIEGRQNEKYFFYHCKKFEYNHDYVIFLRKIDDDTLEYQILFFGVNNFTISKIVTIFDNALVFN